MADFQSPGAEESVLGMQLPTGIDHLSSVYGETSLEEIFQIAAELLQEGESTGIQPHTPSSTDPEQSQDEHSLNSAGNRLPNGLSAPLLPRQIFESSQSKAATPTPLSGVEPGLRLPTVSSDALPSSNFFGAMRYVDESRELIPPRDLSDELVFLYFQNIHPFCPVLNEHTFCLDYFSLSEDDFLSRFPLILLLAIFQTALGYVNADQLRRAGYRTVHQAQSEYYQTVRKMYHYARFQTSNKADEIVLAKTALLCSYWHYQDSDTEINSCWADRALTHAKAVLQSPNGGEPSKPSLPKTLYWCCIIRIALINTGMRRTYRLHEELLDPVFTEEELREELRQELASPMLFGDADNERIVCTFTSFCRLSRILGSIMHSKKQAVFQSQWSSQATSSGFDNAGNDLGGEMNDYVLGFLEAGEFEGQLLQLLRDFSERIEDLKGAYQIQSYLDNTVSRNTVAEHYLRVLIHSSIALLYSSYLSTPKQPWAQSCQTMALEKLKTASNDVACVIDDLMVEVNLEQIPSSILAWMALPISHFLIEGRKRKTALNNSKAQESTLSVDESPQKAQRLLELARGIATRFEGAIYVWMLLEEVNRLINLNQGDKKKQPGRPGRKRNPQLRVEPLNKHITKQESEEKDLDLLVRATKLLDLNFAYGSSRL